MTSSDKTIEETVIRFHAIHKDQITRFEFHFAAINVNSVCESTCGKRNISLWCLVRNIRLKKSDFSNKQNAVECQFLTIITLVHYSNLATASLSLKPIFQFFFYQFVVLL